MIVILHSTQVIGAVWTVRIVTRFHFMQPIRTIAERTTGQRRPHSQTLSVLHGQPDIKNKQTKKDLRRDKGRQSKQPSDGGYSAS